MANRFLNFLRRTLQPPDALTAITAAPIDDRPGWTSHTNRPHDYDPARLQEIYADALEAWRKNPIAWRAVAITTDYIIADTLTVSSHLPPLSKFIKAFWHHNKNHMPTRLESMSDELSRAGDLFVLLFRNPQDGMSYIRFVTKDRIAAIETAGNDWETEISYTENDNGNNRVWLSPAHPEAAAADAIMLHYAINKPLGAVLGESDLVTMLPWLLRYSRMLEDRVRLHWAMRAFLWLITVPTNRVSEKQEQYRTPPEPGSLIIKDESENWQAVTPSLQGADARHDMQAVRAMIDAGSGYPPHWRGDAGDISLATAQAMQGPTERHLKRRQQYFVWMLQDILYHAYQRAAEIGKTRSIPALNTATNYDDILTVHLPDLSRFDNESLSQAAANISKAFTDIAPSIAAMPPTLARETLRILLKFTGEPITQELLDRIIAETRNQKKDQVSQ